MSIFQLSAALESKLGIADLEIPYLQFDPNWEIKMRFPSVGAATRFNVRQGSAEVSVYLDSKDVLGCVGEPYWEIYPAGDGDTERFLLNESRELLLAISQSLEYQTNE